MLTVSEGLLLDMSVQIFGFVCIFIICDIYGILALFRNLHTSKVMFSTLLDKMGRGW